MILEIAQLQVRQGQAKEFEVSFAIAQKIIASMPGYLGHMSFKSALSKITITCCLFAGNQWNIMKLGFVNHQSIKSGASFFTTSMIHFPLCCTMKKFDELQWRSAHM